MNKVKNYFFEEGAKMSSSDFFVLSFMGASFVLAIYAVSKIFL